ncbi:MAG: sigma-54-dependent transcriptional regulator [Planctomycetota bacterium]
MTSWPLRRLLEDQGLESDEVAGLAEVEDDLRASRYDLVVLNLASAELEALDALHALDPELPVVVLSGPASVRGAVEAMGRGALHYARRRSPSARLAELVGDVLRRTRLQREVRRLIGAREPSALLGGSPRMLEVRRALGKIARSPSSTVLITGESGTGKSLAARKLHRESERAERPFLTITCSALPEQLLESELFGHERGAFTDAKQRKLGLLEQADQGTVFLDEIGEMSLKLQAKLLRFLEERCFRRVGGTTDVRPDVRVIAATNRDLEGDVHQGSFRADLYFRLAVIRVHLPPLRERPGDVARLAKYFVCAFNRAFGREVQELTAEAQARLEAHDWPGNIRELRNTIERVMLLCEAPRITAADLPRLSRRERSAGLLVLPPSGLSLRTLERELVVQALERTHGNQTRAAELLGMTRDQIRYRIAKFNLSPESRYCGGDEDPALS